MKKKSILSFFKKQNVVQKPIRRKSSRHCNRQPHLMILPLVTKIQFSYNNSPEYPKSLSSETQTILPGYEIRAVPSIPVSRQWHFFANGSETGGLLKMFVLGIVLARKLA